MFGSTWCHHPTLFSGAQLVFSSETCLEHFFLSSFYLFLDSPDLFPLTLLAWRSLGALTKCASLPVVQILNVTLQKHEQRDRWHRSRSGRRSLRILQSPH